MNNPQIMAYASRTGTRRNLSGLRRAGWRLVISPRGVQRTEGFRYGLDNGAWTAFTHGEPLLDLTAFERSVSRFGADADWIVVPDIVGGGVRSLALSEAWLPRLEDVNKQLLIAVQDGMAPSDVAPLLGSTVGLFVGGTTAWKLRTMRKWGKCAKSAGCWCHIGRVNSAKRIRACIDAGATSFDGSSASRFFDTLELLERARQKRKPAMLAYMDGDLPAQIGDVP